MRQLSGNPCLAALFLALAFIAPTARSDSPAPAGKALRDAAPEPRGAAPANGFLCYGSPPASIVYVVDASGSTFDLFPFMLDEVKRSIVGLDAKTRFAVIFFQQGRAVEAGESGLKSPGDKSGMEVLAWLEEGAGKIVPHGSSDPLAAVERALGYKPDLVYLLSDDLSGRGRFELSQERLLAEIKRMNTRRVKINTVQLVRPGVVNWRNGLRFTLEQIAHSTGGLFKFVSRRELESDR